MGLEVYHDAPGDIKAWEDLIGNSFINSPGFVSIWKERGGTPLFIIDKQDGRYRAGLALVIFGRIFFRRMESMPSGLPGGFFFVEGIDSGEREDFVKKALNLIKTYRPWRVVINNSADNLTSFGYLRSQSKTHLLTLSDDWEAHPNPKIREHIRSAQKRGARIEAFSNSEDLPHFYDMARKAEREHDQGIRYSFRFFARLWKLSQIDSRIIWLKAILDDKMIAARISFVEHDFLINWQLYQDWGKKSYKPGYLLMDCILKQAKTLGLESVNMGGSPEEATPLKGYKERWGGRETEAPYYVYHNLPGRVFLKRGRS